MKNLFINGETLMHDSGYTVSYIGAISQEDESTLHFGEFEGIVKELNISEYHPMPIKGYDFKDSKGITQPYWDELEDIRQFLGVGDVLVFVVDDKRRQFYALFNSWDFRDFEEEWNRIEDYNRGIGIFNKDRNTSETDKQENLHLYFMPISEEIAFAIVDEGEENEGSSSLVGINGQLIIHPGETLKEIMDNEGIDALRLAPLTKMSEEYIQKVIDGKKEITPEFSENLYKALGIHEDFWNNLQDNYEKEMRQFKELERARKGN